MLVEDGVRVENLLFIRYMYEDPAFRTGGWLAVDESFRMPLADQGVHVLRLRLEPRYISL